CSQVAGLNLDRQLNVHAFLVLQACAVSAGKATPPGASDSTSAHRAVAAAIQVGGTDRDVIAPLDSSMPHDTQSESMVAANGNTVVVDYIDSRDEAALEYSGASYSTDGGTTWTRIDPFATGHGGNYGDPLLVYNQKFGTFVAGDLVGG